MPAQQQLSDHSWSSASYVPPQQAASMPVYHGGTVQQQNWTTHPNTWSQSSQSWAPQYRQQEGYIPVAASQYAPFAGPSASASASASIPPSPFNPDNPWQYVPRPRKVRSTSGYGSLCITGPRRAQATHADTKDSGVSGLYTQRTGSMSSSHQIFDSPGSLYANPVAPAAAPSVPGDGSALLDEEEDWRDDEARCSAADSKTAKKRNVGEAAGSAYAAAEDDYVGGHASGDGDQGELDVLEQEPNWIIGAVPTTARQRRLSI